MDLLLKFSVATLNVDAWSSRRQRRYLGITAPFVDNKWTLRHLLLGCPRFFGNDTSEAILEMVILCVHEFGIKDKIYFVGTDNGANVVAAFDEWLPGFIEDDVTRIADDSRDEYNEVAQDDEDRVCVDDLVPDDSRTADLEDLIQHNFLKLPLR